MHLHVRSKENHYSSSHRKRFAMGCSNRSKIKRYASVYSKPDQNRQETENPRTAASDPNRAPPRILHTRQAQFPTHTRTHARVQTRLERRDIYARISTDLPDSIDRTGGTSRSPGARKKERWGGGNAPCDRTTEGPDRRTRRPRPWRSAIGESRARSSPQPRGRQEGSRDGRTRSATERGEEANAT